MGSSCLYITMLLSENVKVFMEDTPELDYPQALVIIHSCDDGALHSHREANVNETQLNRPHRTHTAHNPTLAYKHGWQFLRRLLGGRSVSL